MAVAIVAALIGCDKPPATAPPATPASVRIASLSPAATELLVAMNAGDRLVAVSNYDGGRPETLSLPRVGDYQQVDWEKIATIKPNVMVVQIRPDRLPPGLMERAKSRGIRLVNINIDDLPEIFTAAQSLADAMGDPAAAKTLTDSVNGKLDAVRQRVAGKPRLRTLIVVDPAGKYVAGHGTFLSDLLDIAGGENALAKEAGEWPSIDREMLLSLKPDVILQLMPDASPQVLDQAKAVWPTLPNVPAVKNGRVYVITDWFIHHPGSHVADTAAIFADKLHGP